MFSAEQAAEQTAEQPDRAVARAVVDVDVVSGADRSCGAVGVVQARLRVLAESGRVLASQIRSLQAELVGVAAEVRHLEGSLASGTVRQWLGLEWGLTPGEAARTVRLAERLSLLPQLRVAFAAGKVSEGTVELLARVATPENEGRLLATAEVATGGQLQTLVRDLQRVTAAGGSGEDPVAEPADGFRWHIDEGGRYRWGGSSAPDQGAAIVAAIDAARAADLDDGGSGAQPLSNSEALARVADAYLGGLVDDDGVLAERYLTILHIRDGAAYLQDGGAVDPAVARLMACCSWATAVTVVDGAPVTATSRTRLATPTQRRALLVRDRCCQYPGCGRTRHLRAHHVRHREHGGPTQLDNLMLLCPTHH